MSSKLRTGLLYAIIAVLITQSGAATASEETEIIQEMQSAIEEQQKPENQAEYDATYTEIKTNADTATNAAILAEIQTLKTALEQAKEANKDNPVRLAAINRTVEQITALDPAAMYNQEKVTIPTSSASTSDDQAAITEAANNITSEISATKLAIDAANTEYETDRRNRLSYASANATKLLNNSPNLPNVSDGSQATIYAVDDTGQYFYIDGGELSEVYSGQRYGVIDTDGNFIAHLEIVLVSKEYSIGTMVYSDEAVKGYAVTGIYTKKDPPPTSEGGA